MQYTGERFIPEYKENSVMELEHFHRYLYASKFCKNKTVLDIACGAGYGTNMISTTAAKVIGADIDNEVVKYCQNKYKNANIEFRTLSIDEIDFPENFFDVITCFETIEHVDKVSQDKALDLFGKILKEDGILFISTPSTESKLHIKDNKYHVNELSMSDFKDTLHKRFKYVHI